MKARNASLDVVYERVNISTDLRSFLRSWSYTDNLSGEADDLRIELEDRYQLWLNSWMPDKGAKLQTKILRENWDYEGQYNELPIGLFEIDEVEIGGPPSVVVVKGISVPESSSIKGEKKTKAWEQTNLKVIAQDIAGKAGLELFYDTSEKVEYDRVDRRG